MIADTPDLRLWIARLVVGKSVAPLLPGSEEALLEAARAEGMAALLADALAQWQEAPAYLRDVFRSVARDSAAYELACQVEARSITAALAASGVRALVLKGTALGYWLYAQPAHRSRGDFDFLVEDREHAETAAALLRESGYGFDGPKVDEAAGFETALERTTVGGLVHRVDLHWRLMNNAALARGFGFDELWGASIAIPELHAKARGLGSVYALAHAVLHRITNMPLGQQDRLIWLYDVHLLAKVFAPDDWRALVRLCGEKAIATPCLDGLHASRAAFGTEIPVEAEDALHALGTRENWRLEDMHAVGAMDRAHLAGLSWMEKISWLWRKVFPSPEFMRFRYGASGIAGLFMAYARRWCVGIRRGMRID